MVETVILLSNFKNTNKYHCSRILYIQVSAGIFMVNIVCGQIFHQPCGFVEIRCQYIRMLHLKLGTAIGASFVFQGETAQNAEREEENRTAYTQTSVIIFQHANSTCWTAIYYDNFRWHSDRRLTDSPIAGWNGTDLFRHNDFGRSMRTGLCRVNWCKASSWNGI